MRRARVVVTGRVQGVGFRWSCRREAERVGVAGWVRNLPDGRVEVVAEGADEDVGALVAWCGVGPPGAVVDVVEDDDEVPVGERGFRVVHGAFD